MKARLRKKIHAVDLDGTLAKYSGFKGPTIIGEPVPSMVDRVKAWLKKGEGVKIFTARANEKKTIPAIKRWLVDQGLPSLPVTNIKEHEFYDIWDDRAVHVQRNTGRIVG